ncbi:MAG: hypothetical protein J5I81_15015 [Nitrococcus mobilis]|nr:hypothetical protein [Nitrococcus mobilis]
MTDDNVVIKHLQAIRGVLEEHGERLDRIETRLSSIEHTVGFIYAGAGDDHNVMQALSRCVDRIERRENDER